MKLRKVKARAAGAMLGSVVIQIRYTCSKEEEAQVLRFLIKHGRKALQDYAKGAVRCQSL